MLTCNIKVILSSLVSCFRNYKEWKKEKWDLNNYHWLESDDTQRTKGTQPIKKIVYIR